MGINHLPGDAESQSGAAGFGGIEGIEDFRDAVVGDPATIIAEPDGAHSDASALVGNARNREVDFTLTLNLGHRIDRVVDNVREDLAELVRIGAHYRPIEVRARNRDGVRL